MAIILSLETSTKVCSVCVAENNVILVKKELYEANSHATHLTVFIQEMFDELKDVSFKDINAVAVSCGPGSYTGLRIGVSTAKGICYALGIPLIAITSLQVLANAVKDHQFVKDGALICPMIDARRMEVYTALYDSGLKKVKDIEAKIIDEDSFLEELKKNKIVFVGDGSEKCKDVISGGNAFFIQDTVPLAANMTEIAYAKYKDKKFEDVAYFEPFYLKDFVATKPKNKVFD